MTDENNAGVQGRACLYQADREVWLSPDEWSVYDTTRSYTVTNPESVEQLVLIFPRPDCRKSWPMNR